MIEFDKEDGDMKENMTPKDFMYWDELYKKIEEGGVYLGEGGLDNMNDVDRRVFIEHMFSFIPRRLHREIDCRLDGFGGWRS